MICFTTDTSTYKHIQIHVHVHTDNMVVRAQARITSSLGKIGDM